MSAWLASTMSGVTSKGTAEVHGEVLTGVVVAQTYFIPSKAGREAHYQIHVRPTRDPLPPRANGRLLCASKACSCTLLLTRSERVYDAALNLEGTGLPVRIAWHQAKRDGQACQVATSIERHTGLPAALVEAQQNGAVTR